MVEVTVEHLLRGGDVDVGAHILDAGVVQHLTANAVATADVGLAGFELVGLGRALAQFKFVETRLQHGHRLGAIAVLPAVVLVLHDDAGRQMRDADRRVGLVDVLATGAIDEMGCRVAAD